MLTQQMKSLIENNTLGSVATVTPSGLPRVSPKGTFVVWNDKTLVFSNIRSPETVTNIEHTPAVEVLFTDVFHRTGCRVSGTARYSAEVENSEYIDVFKEKWATLAHLIQGVCHYQHSRGFSRKVSKLRHRNDA